MGIRNDRLFRRPASEVIHENVELELIEKIQTNEGEGYQIKMIFQVCSDDHVVTYSDTIQKMGIEVYL